MRYDGYCGLCDTIREYDSTVEERDAKRCRVCEEPLERLFSTANILVPEVFSKYSLSALAPTYEEQKMVDDRNDAYLRNKPREIPKPTFAKCLDDTCVELKVEPSKLHEYTVREAVC